MRYCRRYGGAKNSELGTHDKDDDGEEEEKEEEDAMVGQKRSNGKALRAFLQ